MFVSGSAGPGRECGRGKCGPARNRSLKEIAVPSHGVLVLQLQWQQSVRGENDLVDLRGQDQPYHRNGDVHRAADSFPVAFR